MREIVDGPFEIGMGYVSVHVIFDADGVVLVDTGLPGRAANVGKCCVRWVGRR